MAEDASFQDLIQRVRRGEGDASAELVRRYEPAIRRVVRIRLVDRRLRRLYDSMDFCQSVLASFFLRAALGQYDLDTPEQLLRLLESMTRHKVADQARKQQAACRDLGRASPGGLEALDVPAGGDSPSQQVALGELLDRLRGRLTSEERRLADLRTEGWGWTEIAAEVGGTPDGLRMKLDRAVTRAWAELGLDG